MIELYDPKDVSCLPKSLRLYGASDYATMEVRACKREPDFTEHGIWGVDSIGDLWAVDWWFKQCETDVGIKAFTDLVRQHKPRKWFNEGGIIDKAIGPSIRSAMRHANSWVAIDELPLLMDKSVKLQAFHARATAGCVHFPIPGRTNWSERVISQLVKFPGGRWDDAADVCGLIGRAVDKLADAQVPFNPRRSVIRPFTEAWMDLDKVPDKPKVKYFS
jgi:predicted phage terminase large subunit-like protein